MDWYKKLKNKFYDLTPLKVEMRGGLWGLACNSIHFIDLISWWTGENVISIDSKKLDPNKTYDLEKPFNGKLIDRFSFLPCTPVITVNSLPALSSFIISSLMS